ncbi:tryptophan synthase subunit alpha [uncultured archaeon]|nr:tryptophan synthase subunit alpha [uncultured archaeon]
MRKNLILYFTLGFPDQGTLESFSRRISQDEVDYVEFGFPSGNPVYDGPKIRGTHKTAMSNYRPEDGEKLFRDLLGKGIKLYSLTYYRDIRDDGGKFLSYLKREGFSGIIVPDLLVDYSDSAFSAIGRIHEAGLDFIPFFNPSTPDRIIKEISSKTGSWIYYGLQPSTGINVPFDTGEVAERINELVPGREINFGFGIRNNDQVRELVSYGASGVAIGTALIEMLSSGDEEAFYSYLKEMRGVLDGK